MVLLLGKLNVNKSINYIKQFLRENCYILQVYYKVGLESINNLNEILSIIKILISKWYYLNLF